MNSCCPVFLNDLWRFLAGSILLTCSKRNNCAINLELIITHHNWIMLLKNVFLPALYLLVNNNSPNYRYKSVEVWIHSWKWWKCLLKCVPEMETVIRFDMLTTGFFGYGDRSTAPRDGNPLFIRGINAKGGNHFGWWLSLFQEIWATKEASKPFSAIQVLTSSCNRKEHTLDAVLINSRPLITLVFRRGFMKTRLPFVVWICHLYDSDSYHRSL